MKNRLNTKEIATDVLIIGGGTAGCYAALVLSEQKAGRVLIAEKANIRRSGCLAAGVNAINAYIVRPQAAGLCRLCNKGCRRDRKAGPSSYSSEEFQRSYCKDGKAWACDPEG